MQRRRGQPAIRSKLGAFRSRALSGGRIRLWHRQGCSILKSLVALLQLGLEANLDNLTRAIITEFGYQEVGHLRALKTSVGGIQRPLMDLSAKSFAKLIDEAFGFPLDPPFYPYRDSLSYTVGSYMVPYVGLNGYTGSNPFLCGYLAKRLATGLLSPESGQDRIVRGHLFGRADQIVMPYNYTVARFTTRISNLRNRLGMCGIKSLRSLELKRRLVAMSCPWAVNSFSYPRSPEEILRISYGTSNEHVPGRFFPQGGKWKNCKKASKEENLMLQLL